MSEIINETLQEDFATLLEQSIKTLNTGDKVMGTVTGIGNTEVQVDLGTKHAGYIPYDEVIPCPYNNRQTRQLCISNDLFFCLFSQQ